MANFISKPRRLQFGLRFLFAVTTLAAIACWAYWVALPRYRVYRQQVAFEESVKLLRAGMTPDACAKVIQWPSKTTIHTQVYNSQGYPTQTVRYRWPNVIYLVHFVFPKQSTGRSSSNACVSVEVFRLPPVPANYEARTPGGQHRITKMTPRPKSEEVPDEGYLTDLLEIIIGDRRDDYGLKYDVIHADHPAAPGP